MSAAPLDAALARFTLAQSVSGHMTCRQIAVLLAVAAEPGTSIGPIARRIGCQKPPVTRETDALQAAGLMRKAEDQGDRRRRVLRLTPEGEDMARRLAQ